VALLLGTVLLLAILSITVASGLRNSSASLADTVGYGASAAAMAAAESGVERSHGLLAQALMSDTYNKTPGVTTCEQLAGHGLALGTASFSVSPSPLIPLASDEAPCGDPMGCDLCTVQVVGEAGGIRKRVKADFLIKKMEGVAGRGSVTERLYLDVASGESAILTVLTARSKDGGGSNAVVNGCDVARPGESVAVNFNCGRAWRSENTGEGKTNGYGFFADSSDLAVLAAGRYSVQGSFANNQGAAVRPYLMNGVVLEPLAGESIVALGKATPPGATGVNRMSSGSVACGAAVPAGDLPLASTAIFGFSGISTVACPVDPAFQPGSSTLPAAVRSLMGQADLIISQTEARVSADSANERLCASLRYFHNPVVRNAAGGVDLTVVNSRVYVDSASASRLTSQSGGLRPLLLKTASNTAVVSSGYSVSTATGEVGFSDLPDGVYQAGLAPMQPLHAQFALANSGPNAGGYLCFAGVDPDRIAALRNVPLTRVGWSEVID
jgi:hypothetical protein